MDREIQNMFTAIQKRLESIDKKYGNDPKPVYLYSKTAYIDDTEVTFENVPNGNLSLFMVDGDNQPVPCRYERINNDVRVMFEQRTSLATVTIQIS